MNERLSDEVRYGEKQQTTTAEALTRGVQTVIPSSELLATQMDDRRIRLYLGIDPTSPDLHIGHTVPMRKLRQFQDLGHEVILLFGTFTGMIGDPTDKSAARVRLTKEQIDRNIATYAEQASRILDMRPNCDNPIRIRHNHEWLGKLTFDEVVDVASNFTVQQMLQRDMFQKRIMEEKPLYLHELMYPLMQGWDAVALDVDLEVGGSDQLFNMMTGRVLVQRYKGHEKWVMGTKLIEDPSGRKMGKTEGNIVNIRDFPEVLYEALMTWPDNSIPLGLELLSDVPMHTVRQVDQELRDISEGNSATSVLDIKEGFAHRVVNQIHGEEAANYAQEEFGRVKREKLIPRRIRPATIDSGTSLSDFLVSSGLASSRDKALSRITQGAIYVDGKRTRNDVGIEDNMLVSIGKNTIRNIRRATRDSI